METFPVPIPLIAVWGAITLALLGTVMYRGILEQREDDQLFLDKAEEHMAQEQRQLVNRIQKLDSGVKALGITSGALLFLIAVIFVWRGLQNF